MTDSERPQSQVPHPEPSSPDGDQNHVTSNAAPLLRRPWYVSLVFALIAVTVLLGGVALYNRVKNPFPFFGTTYTPPRAATMFSGTVASASGQTAQSYTFAPKGKTTALFFGFTHCPNICPLTLAYLQKVKTRLTAEQQKNFQVVLVSVDPQRDTPQQLKSYMDYFGGGTGVNIPEPRLSEVARAYGVGYSKADIKSKDVYQVNHTTATYLIDREGQLRLLWDYTQMAQLDKIVADIQEVMR